MNGQQLYPWDEDLNGMNDGAEQFPSNPSDIVSTVHRELNIDDYSNASSILDDLGIDSLISDFMINEPSPVMPQHVIDDPESPYIGQWDMLTLLRQNGSQNFKNEFCQIWIDVANPWFNFTFRKDFSHVIERMRWDLVNVADNEPNGINMLMARKMAEKLCFNVDLELQKHSEEDYRYQLELQKSKLQDSDPCSNLSIVQFMQNILSLEARIIHTEEQQGSIATNSNGYHGKEELIIKMEPSNDALSRSSIINAELSKLEGVSHSGAETVRNLDSKVRSLQLRLGGKLAYIDQYNPRDLNQEELKGLALMKEKRDEIFQEEQRVLQHCHCQHYKTLEALHSKVLYNEIKEWQRNQAYINNGRTMTHYCKISTLQDWCKRMATLISGNLKQMDVLESLDKELGFWHRQPAANVHLARPFIENLTSQYSMLLQQLVQNCLVVEEQPPQVLMKEKRFQCRLQHLVGDGLDIHQVPFRVSVSLINAEQAAKVMSEGSSSEFKKSGTIVNCDATADFSAHTRILSVTMRNMCLKMQQRGPQRAAEMVAELKFAMLFRAQIMVRYSQSVTNWVTAQTFSLPIVVISHGKQEADAQATIFWDNAFAKSDRTRFTVERSVPWAALLEALDGRWRKDCQEDNKAVGLTPAAREYLTRKLFDHPTVSSNTMISWQKFNHDKLCCGGPNDRKELFTFWSWFFKAMELCSSQYVKKFWNMGVIHGFLNKGDCQKMLSETGTPGVFLFRFSETKPGALSISHSATINGQLVVRHLEPDTISNFKMRSLADGVMDLDYLYYLYPNKNKIDVFSRYTVAKEAPAGYVQKGLVVSTEHPAASLSPRTLFSPSPHMDSHDSSSSMQEDSK